MEVLKDMGMTDKQFNGFIRFLIDDLREAKEEKDAEKKDKRIQKILENLQSTLEDQYYYSGDLSHRYFIYYQLVICNMCQVCVGVLCTVISIIVYV